MKILMLGWEFPPFFAGGVGIACYELSKVLQNYSDLDVTYIMPAGPDSEVNLGGNFKLMGASKIPIMENFRFKNFNFEFIRGAFLAYDTFKQYEDRVGEYSEELIQKLKDEKAGKMNLYGENLIEEMYLFAQRVASRFKDTDFDIIHAHDWTTIPAALLLKEITGKPVVLHVHITELDKNGGNGGHEKIFEIEKLGFYGADRLIAVSNFTKNRLMHNYGVPESKISVIHNGGISDMTPQICDKSYPEKTGKLVLFAGRITQQKGPEFFLHAAKKVLEYEPSTKFAIIGPGDLVPRIIELRKELGIEENVLITGKKYSREEADKYYSMADVFVMPSVSEPFGIVPLEAVSKGTAVVVSKQSGISEVLDHSFKVDFWDVDEMAHKILALLKYDNLHHEIRHNAYNDFDKFSWEKPTEKIVNLYHQITGK